MVEITQSSVDENCYLNTTIDAGSKNLLNKKTSLCFKKFCNGQTL